MTIVACIDGGKLSQSVCDYGIELAKTHNLPLTLLHIIEKNTYAKVNLSGAIGLGSRDNLLEELTSEDEQQSKQEVKHGKELLISLKEYASKKGFEDVNLAHRHGLLSESLLDLEREAKVVIIGLKGQDSENKNIPIGKQVENILKSLHIPIILINGSHKPIKKVLIAYDGSNSSKKALDAIVSRPLLGDVQRDIISVNNDQALQEAKERLSSANLNANFVLLHGDPVDEITKYQKENQIDLIAMGAFGHGAWHNIIFGSVTHQMLIEASVPLLFLR
ncbi:MAG TPA: universal stress protein [Epsilonproteobacteria bacterium]|nr:universal stress protein [Campylobacterota bacterium]